MWFHLTRAKKRQKLLYQSYKRSLIPISMRFVVFFSPPPSLRLLNMHASHLHRNTQMWLTNPKIPRKVFWLKTDIKETVSAPGDYRLLPPASGEEEDGEVQHVSLCCCQSFAQHSAGSEQRTASTLKGGLTLVQEFCEYTLPSSLQTSQLGNCECGANELPGYPWTREMAYVYLTLRRIHLQNLLLRIPFAP